MANPALPKQKDSGISPLDKLIEVPGGEKDAGIFLKDVSYTHIRAHETGRKSGSRLMH